MLSHPSELLLILAIALATCVGSTSAAEPVVPNGFKRPENLFLPAPKRAWGPEQAIGEPDTPRAGDISTAWASATQDGQDEWLELTFGEAVKPAEVHVYETYNPGALVKITANSDSDMEAVLWKGKDPTARDAGMGVSKVKVTAAIKTNRLRIHLNSADVPGWNEIDTVGIKDASGKMHWPTAAKASSTYASGPDPGLNLNPEAALEYIKQLEQEIQRLRNRK